MLGLTPPQSTGPDSTYSAVRVDWQQQGQPFQKITDDVTYLRCVEEDDLYNRVRDVQYIQNGFVKVTSYTRVWRVYWTVYGPNSSDNARKLRSRLFDEDVEALIEGAQLYWIPDPSAPTRVPEEWGTGQWWERVDFSARFNELVKEQYSAQSVISAEVIGFESIAGQIFDLEIQGAYPAQLPTQSITVQNGSLVSSGIAPALTLSAATVTNVIIGSQSYSGSLGTCSLQTGPLSSGSITTGGTFADGGQFLLSYMLPSGASIQYIATMSGLVWSESTLSSGQIIYTMTGNLQAEQADGTFQLTTASVGTVSWSGTAAVQSIQIGIQ